MFCIRQVKLIWRGGSLLRRRKRLFVLLLCVGFDSVATDFSPRISEEIVRGFIACKGILLVAKELQSSFHVKLEGWSLGFKVNHVEMLLLCPTEADLGIGTQTHNSGIQKSC